MFPYVPYKRPRLESQDYPSTSLELTQAQKDLVKTRRWQSFSERLKKRLTDNSWTSELSDEFHKPYWARLVSKLVEEKENQHVVFPPESAIFDCFNLCSLDKVKVVILGKEPYCGPGQADGLAFSVSHGIAIPPDLQDLFQVLRREFPGYTQPNHGNLETWVRQGVLLLNTSLTVRMNCLESHKNFGWSSFVERVLTVINQRKSGVIFIFWGQETHIYRSLITNSNHVLQYPAPLLSQECYFSRCNEILIQQGQTPIDWTLDNSFAVPRGLTTKRLRTWDIQEPS